MIFDDPVARAISNAEPTAYQRRYLIYCAVKNKKPRAGVCRLGDLEEPRVQDVSGLGPMAGAERSGSVAF